VGSPPRNEIAGGIYHVIARGVDRRRIFADSEDYETYMRLLATVTRRQGWHLLCYCLIPNHVHLMIETPETNLANGMQWVR
jgi:REP element-mobilizing transposase RayT